MELNSTDIVSGKYYWPRLTADVKAYISSHILHDSLYLLVCIEIIGI